MGYLGSLLLVFGSGGLVEGGGCGCVSLTVSVLGIKRVREIWEGLLVVTIED